MRVEIEGYIRLEENEDDDKQNKTLIDLKVEWSGKIDHYSQLKLLKEIKKQVDIEIEAGENYGEVSAELDIRKKI